MGPLDTNSLLLTDLFCALALLRPTSRSQGSCSDRCAQSRRRAASITSRNIPPYPFEGDISCPDNAAIQSRTGKAINLSSPPLPSARKGEDWPAKTADRSTISAKTPMAAEKYANAPLALREMAMAESGAVTNQPIAIRP